MIHHSRYFLSRVAIEVAFSACSTIRFRAIGTKPAQETVLTVVGEKSI